MLDGLYKYAKLQYECGNYQDCLTYLTYYGVLIPNSSQQYLNALWGKLAAEILIFRWEDALADIARINDVIENSVRCRRRSLDDACVVDQSTHLCCAALLLHDDRRS